MRDETRYPHCAVKAAAFLIREAIVAGEAAAVVGADSRATWAAAHLALGIGTQVGDSVAEPYLIELTGPMATSKPMLSNMVMWIYMLAASRSGADKGSIVQQIVREAEVCGELCANDKGDFGAEYAACAMRVAGTRVVLWLYADQFAGLSGSPGAARLIENMTGPLRAAGIGSILCFEGAVTEGWTPDVTCPVGARPVHVARYGSRLDTYGGLRASGAWEADIEEVRALVMTVAAGNGKDAAGVVGDAEARALCEGSAGCARTLIEWTKAAVRQRSAGTVAWEDFERNAPSEELRRALVSCAESAERTVHAMYEDKRKGCRTATGDGCGRVEWMSKLAEKLGGSRRR